MKSAEERAAARAAKEQARLVAGTTRHLELPVPPDEALSLLKEAVELRTPMMKLLRYTGESAEVSIVGGNLGIWGQGGNIGATTALMGRGIGVKVDWAPHAEGTQFTAYAPTVGAMFVMRTEIYSLWRALRDAWDARERWDARR